MRIRHCPTAGLVALTFIAGCGLTDPPERAPVTFWNAELAPLAPAETTISGQAAAIARQRVTEVGVGVTAIPPDLVLTWGAFDGSCADPGNLLGTEINYPTLSEDTTSAEGVIGLRLEAGEAYHVAVADADTGERLACGDLTLRDD